MSFPVARRLSHSLADISIELIKVDITGVVVGVFTLLLRRIWFFFDFDYRQSGSNCYQDKMTNS